MARHYRRRHHHHRRRNPFGLSSGVFVDAGWNAAGALGSLYLSGLISSLSGWAGVAATGGAAVAMGFAGKMVGAKAGEELLKGGIMATIIKAIHQLGVLPSIGLGLYAPSYFAIPTASSQYLQAGAPGGGFNRGAGSIFFPGPGGAIAALPAAGGTAVHPAAVAAKMAGMGFHRFRSRYAGNY